MGKSVLTFDGYFDILWMGICVEMLYDQSNLNNFYNMELKKKKKKLEKVVVLCVQ